MTFFSPIKEKVTLDYGLGDEMSRMLKQKYRKTAKFKKRNLGKNSYMINYNETIKDSAFSDDSDESREVRKVNMKVKTSNLACCSTQGINKGGKC